MLDRNKIVFGQTKVIWHNTTNDEKLKDDPRLGQVGVIRLGCATNNDLYNVQYTTPAAPNGLIYMCSIHNLTFAEEDEQLPSITLTHANAKVLQVIVDKCSPMKGLTIAKVGF